MTQKSNSRDLNGFAAFVAAISAATSPVNDLSARLATLSKVFETAALQIAKISNAAQMIASGQQLATCCQCAAAAPPQTTSNTWAYPQTADQAFVISTAVLAGAKLWAEAAKWFWRIVVAPIAAGGVAAIGRLVVPIWRATSVAEALAAVIETVGELIGAIAALVVSAPRAVIASDAALLAGAGYLIRRNWTAVLMALQTLGAAVSREAIGIISKVASAVEGEPESGTGDLGPAGDAAIRRRTNGRRYGLATSVFESVAASLRPLAPGTTIPMSQTQLWSGLRPGHLSLPKMAAIAMLGAPMLAAPTMTALPAGQREADSARISSIVLNSSPTIVINSSQPTDIEHQVIEALRQHREALYEQLCRELQRRQRTEF